MHIGPLITVGKTNNRTGRYIQIPIQVPLPGIHNKIPWAIAINIATKQRQYNEWLANQIFEAARNDRSVLALSDRINQLEVLKALVLEKFRVYGVNKTIGVYIGGKTKQQLHEASQANVVLGTFQMMSEGTDLPKLDSLILCSPRSDVEQVCGRIQRDCPGKKPLLIVDPILTSWRPFASVANKRRFWFKKCGFVESKV